MEGVGRDWNGKNMFVCIVAPLVAFIFSVK
jgi:hypothetical protein